jgi:hypothetical protein
MHTKRSTAVPGAAGDLGGGAAHLLAAAVVGGPCLRLITGSISTHVAAIQGAE